MNYAKIVSFAGILSAVTCFTSTDVCSASWFSWGDSVVSWGRDTIVSWFQGCQHTTPYHQQIFTTKQVPLLTLERLFTAKNEFEPMWNQFFSEKDNFKAIWNCSGKFQVSVKNTTDEKGQNSLAFLLASMNDPILFLETISNDFACQVIGDGIIHTDNNIFVSPPNFGSSSFTAMITFPIPQDAEIVQLYDIIANCVEGHSPNPHHPMLDSAYVRQSICLQLCDLYKKVSCVSPFLYTESLRFDPRNILVAIVREDVQVLLLAELALFFESSSDHQKAVATPLYAAPETIGFTSSMSGKRQEIDIFILAMSIFELATKEKLFSNPHISIFKCAQELANGTSLEKVVSIWAELAPFLEPDPQKRSCDIEHLRKVVATRSFI
jgi:hypothetical protein